MEAESVPNGLWRKLRLCLLLSLVSTKPTVESSSKSAPMTPRTAMNVLIVSNCLPPSLERLLAQAGSMRKIKRWYPADEPVLFSKPEPKNAYLQRSPLSDAKNGVLLVNLDELSKSTLPRLSFVIDNPRLEHHYPGYEIPATMNSNVVVWGTAETNEIRSSSGKTTMRDWAEHIVEMFCSPNSIKNDSCSRISCQDFAQFIQTVSYLDVSDSMFVTVELCIRSEMIMDDVLVRYRRIHKQKL
ncbi:hypothetical protein HDU82_006382 [Entophlyctis luteolus]|nr:hypothetical protein HDU82_006382 [Entophlyctis luteolus]